MDNDQIRMAYKERQPVEDTGTGIVGLIIALKTDPGSDKVHSLVVTGHIPDPVLPPDAEQPQQAERKYTTIWSHQFDRLKPARRSIDK